MTEREILNGVLSSEDPSKNCCLVYFRDIKDIADVRPDAMSDFIDVDIEGEIDADSQALRHHLKARLETFRAENVKEDVFREYTIDWAGDRGVAPDDNALHKVDTRTHVRTHARTHTPGDDY